MELELYFKMIIANLTLIIMFRKCAKDFLCVNKLNSPDRMKIKTGKNENQLTEAEMTSSLYFWGIFTQIESMVDSSKSPFET